MSSTFASVSGNLGHDPETRVFANGNSITVFSVATNEFWTDKEGKKQKRTTWTPVQVPGKYGQTVAKYLKKGHYVEVKGTLISRDVKRTDGSKYQRLELRAQKVDFGPRSQAAENPVQDELPTLEEITPLPDSSDQPF